METQTLKGRPTYHVQLRRQGSFKFKTILSVKHDVIKDFPKLLNEFQNLDAPLGEDETKIILRWLKRGKINNISEGTQVQIIKTTPGTQQFEKVFPPTGYVLEWKDSRFTKRLARGR